jgi:hypothetical protein
MSDHGPKLPRSILPIPDRTHIGLTTYDAKDPNTKCPSIEPLRPPQLSARPRRLARLWGLPIVGLANLANKTGHGFLEMWF